MHSKWRSFLLLKEKHFQLNHKYLFKTTKKCIAPSKDSKTAEIAAGVSSSDDNATRAIIT